VIEDADIVLDRFSNQVIQIYSFFGRLLVSYHNGWKVCLSALSSAFPVARSRTPTAAFQFLGFGYMPPTCPHGQPEGAGVELPGLLSPLILSSSSVVLSFVATSGE